MSKPKLTYFDINGGRGEDCRLALFIAGVDFEDHRVMGDAWREFKPTTPFGTIPTLEINGNVLAQSNAILGFIGEQHGMLPNDAWESARHRSLIAAIEEMRTSLASTLSIKDPEEKKAKREEAASGVLQTWGANMERQLSDNGPFAGGNTLSVADLKLFVFMRWFANGVLDHIPTDVFKNFPKMNRVFEAVQTHEKVAEWYALRSR